MYFRTVVLTNLGNSTNTGTSLSFDGSIEVASSKERGDHGTYNTILGDKLLNILEWFDLEVEDVYFQQDNDPKHTSKMAKKWFENYGCKVLIWSA